MKTLGKYEPPELKLRDAVITLGFATVLTCPLRSITNVPSANVTEPETDEPSAAVVVGWLVVLLLPDSVNVTPEGVMTTPRTIGMADFEVWIPADENTEDPADSDMKQPRK